MDLQPSKEHKSELKNTLHSWFSVVAFVLLLSSLSVLFSSIDTTSLQRSPVMGSSEFVYFSIVSVIVSLFWPYLFKKLDKHVVDVFYYLFGVVGLCMFVGSQKHEIYDLRHSEYINQIRASLPIEELRYEKLQSLFNSMDLSEIEEKIHKIPRIAVPYVAEYVTLFRDTEAAWLVDVNVIEKALNPVTHDAEYKSMLNKQQTKIIRYRAELDSVNVAANRKQSASWLNIIAWPYFICMALCAKLARERVFKLLSH